MAFVQEFNALPVWVQLVILIMVIIVGIGLLRKLGQTFGLTAPPAYHPYFKLTRHIIVALVVSFFLINWWLKLPLLTMPEYWGVMARGAFILTNGLIVGFMTRHMP